MKGLGIKLNVRSTNDKTKFFLSFHARGITPALRGFKNKSLTTGSPDELM